MSIEPPTTLHLADCAVDLARHRLIRDGEAATLTTREAELLAYLVAREGTDVDRDDLLRDVWGHRAATATRAVDFTIRRLRTKIEPDPANPVHIIGVRGVGYRFVGTGGGTPTEDPQRLEPQPAPPAPRPAEVRPRPTEARPLPPLRARFVGRTAELAALDALLDTHRLVTVLGMGGAGKTALALRWAHAARRDGRFPGGVAFCELAAAREPAEVLDAVAAGVGADLDGRATGEQAVEHVAATLDARGQTLVVLDNAEHVDLAPWVGRWLDRTLDARFLVTSRERLQLAGEAVLPLDPLDDVDGAALFVDRAQAARPDAVTQDDAAAVRAIVRGLDGLPLAIEIAASRVATLSPAQLASRLESRFRLITAPAGSRPDRHSSLRATLDWSWELLDPWERKALAVASVFHGGFGLEAVEEVLQLDDVGAPWPLDLLQSLVDKSLVRLETPAGTRALRYRLLESVRAYAAERLPGLVDAATVRARHAAYYVRESEALAAAVEGPGGAEMLDRLAAERGNLMAAWLHAPDAEQRVRAGLALRVVLMHRGPWDGFQALLDALVATAVDVPPSLRARAHVARARFHAEHQPRQADEDLRAALDGSQDPVVRAMALHSLGTLRAFEGREAEAEAHYREAMTLHEAAGARAAAGRDATGLAWALARLGRLDEAERTYQRALAAFRRSGDRGGIGLALANLAGLLEARGEVEAGDAHALEAVEILTEVGDRKSCAQALAQLALRRLRRGDWEQAEADFRRALALQQQIGDRRWEGAVLAELAEVLLHRDQLAEAEALLLTACAIARDTADPLREAQALRGLALLRILEEAPHEAEHHLDAAQALLADGAHAAARAEIARVLALLHLDQGRLDQALALTEQAAAHPSAGPALAALRAGIRARQGQPGALPAVGGLAEIAAGWQAWTTGDRETALAAIAQAEAHTHPVVAVLRRGLERELDP